MIHLRLQPQSNSHLQQPRVTFHFSMHSVKRHRKIFERLINNRIISIRNCIVLLHWCSSYVLLFRSMGCIVSFQIARVWARYHLNSEIHPARGIRRRTTTVVGRMDKAVGVQPLTGIGQTMPPYSTRYLRLLQVQNGLLCALIAMCNVDNPFRTNAIIKMCKGKKRKDATDGAT